MRLVDADKLKGKWFWTDDSDSGKAIDLDTLENAPTVDAIEVVRCKDCTSFDPLGDICRKREEAAEPSGYCFSGEKKTEDMIEALDQYFEKGEGAFASSQVIDAWKRIKNYISDHPIVHCKDCIYSNAKGYDYETDLGIIFCEKWKDDTDENGYCFEGEKR